ncbi:MAG: hypothetical protein ACI4U2_05025 [Christensenellaceae bacterium]
MPEFLTSPAFWIDAVLVVILLIAAIVGLVRGATAILLKFLVGLGCLIGAYFLSRWLIGMEFLAKPLKDLSAWMEGKFFAQDVYRIDLSAPIEEITAALESINLPGFLAKGLMGMLSSMETIPEGMTLGFFFASSIASLLAHVIAFIVLFVLLRVVGIFVVKFCKKAVSLIPIINVLDRILGLVIVVAETLFFLYLALVIVSMIPAATHLIATTTVTKFFFDYNLLGYIFTDTFINSFLDMITEMIQFPTEAPVAILPPAVSALPA